jgi:hypothetical protein
VEVAVGVAVRVVVPVPVVGTGAGAGHSSVHYLDIYERALQGVIDFKTI